MQKLPNWVHIVGVCGVITSGLAVMFKYKGVKVTGSDKGIYPPVSSYLERYDIPVALGYRKERLTDEDGSHPDIVIVQGVKGDSNEEYIEAKRLGISIKSATEILKDYIIHDESIVVAGTYGKTTITAVLVDIFEKASIDVSYMFGGITPEMKETAKLKTEKTKYSIIEGDEYLTSLSDKTSKFFYYKPKYLILNSCQWEHPDLFPDESSYIENFRKLVKQIPKDGEIFANANDKNVVDVTMSANCKVVYYSIDKEKSYIKPLWYLEKNSTPLPTFIRLGDDFTNLEIIPYERKIIGEFNEENFLASTTLAYELGIRKERIQEAISRFRGIKRRLEIKFENDELLVLDDFGSSPPKAEGSLQSLRQDYPDSSIYVIFEPNTGNRTEMSIPTYKGALDIADEIIFPRFTRLPKMSLHRFGEQELADKLRTYYKNITVISDDDILIKTLIKQVEFGAIRHTIIVFMGSHGFRGMIDKLVKYLNLNGNL